MFVLSKLTFIPFTPRNANSDTAPQTYHSDRDSFWREVRGGLNTMFAADIAGMRLYYSEEKYARIVVWCLGLLLDGCPAHIPFRNLSGIKGGIAPLRLLRDLLRDGTLKFIAAPPDVCQHALHDPESVLPHAMAAAKLPPLPRTIPTLKISESRFSDLVTPGGHAAPPKRKQPASTHTRLPALSEERVLDPHTLEPVLTASLGLGSSSQPSERRQRRDINKARHRPISKPMCARKIGALTSSFVLDRPPPKAGPSSRYLGFGSR